MLKPISRKELIKKLRKLSFDGPYSGGKHQFMKCGEAKIFIPNPHGKDIGLVIISQIIKQLNISQKEFSKL